ncbi:hypothetical protein KL86DPRO_11341 [uncultured delta proteobacterium]|uniref:Uncharacterized protein n=1 Tax=uncultured delta proteobacterium TaxID=34034 RepID=A0A212JFG3_9DELT|nr:hypothetical protein KL86DPRO_11341 [uncultured delta proteobacterium]
MVTLHKPEPIFDKLTASIYHDGNLFDYFVERFGAPYPWSVIPGYRLFKNGVFLSSWEKWGWRSIIFKPDQEMVAEFYPFLQGLPPRIMGRVETEEDYLKNPRKPSVVFQEAEIAFDIVLPEMRYITQAEPLLEYFASIIMVNRQQSRIHAIPLAIHERKRQKLYDGTVNGKVTYYIDKLEETEHGKYVKVENPSIDVKMYLKLHPKALDWVLRIEVTLQKEALFKRVGKKLPDDTRVNTDGRNIQLEDFVHFAHFDWKCFDTDFKRICDKKPDAVKEQCKRLRRYARRNKTVAANTLSTILIAKELGSRRLKERIRAGKYYIPVNQFAE